MADIVEIIAFGQIVKVRYSVFVEMKLTQY